MTVEFCLLGDVEMRVDGRVMHLGHARQRRVLAVLLLEANRVVPADQLLERVWAGRAPQRARNTLAGCMSRLRHLLAAAGGAAIARPSGYVLAVDPMAVDLFQFRSMIADVRATDTVADALALFDAALALGYGAACGDLDTPWLNTMREMVDTPEQPARRRQEPRRRRWPAARYAVRDGFHLMKVYRRPAAVASPALVGWCADRLAPFADVHRWLVRHTS